MYIYIEREIMYYIYIYIALPHIYVACFMYGCYHHFQQTTFQKKTQNINDLSAACSDVHPVSITRFPSFRTQTLESLSVDSVTKWIPEQPRPWRKYCERESYYGDRVYCRFK